MSDVRARLWGERAERIEAALRAADPDLAELILGVAYDDVFSRPELDARTRTLLSIALLTALGEGDALGTHVRAALRVGASAEEIRATVLHSAMFVGFPRALAAMRVIAGVPGAAPPPTPTAPGDPPGGDPEEPT